MAKKHGQEDMLKGLKMLQFFILGEVYSMYNRFPDLRI